MKKIADKLKSIIKRPADKDTFGTNPMDPWSTKANISESKMLDQYLKARGINPIFLTKDAKISHAKSFAFQRWRQQHQVEEIQMEEVDEEDTITFDIPLFIRVLEFAREDAKDDMALHKMTEKLISIRDKGTLTMADYDFITKLKEEMGLDESALEKWRKAAAEREKKHDQAEKEMKARHASGKEDMKGSIDRLEKALNKEESEFMKGVKKKVASNKADKYSHYSKTDKEQGREVSSKLYGQMAKHQKKLSQEEVEQIDELSKDTLKSYIKGAKGSKNLEADAVRTAEYKGNHAWASDATQIVNKRKEGIKTAKAKLNAEEVEQLDELSLDTLKSAAKKNAEKAWDYHMDDNKRWAGISASRALNLKAKIARKERQMKANEEVEQIDELNYDTVKSLYDKRRDDYRGDKVGETKKGKKVSAKNVGTSISRLMGFKPTQNKPEPKNEEVEIDESQAHDEGHRDRWYHRKPNSGYEVGSQEHKDYMDAYTGRHKQQLKNVKTFGKTGEIKTEETEQIDELKKSTVKSWLSQQDVIPPKKPGMDRKAFNKRVKTRSASWDRALDRLSGHKPTSENTLDPKAATEAPVDGANTSESCGCKKKEMSKSARMIKALYKKKGVVKEDMYDHEKEDKSVATYGKKPKMSKLDKEKGMGEDKDQAALTLSGGKTLTGSKRDTVEIDPMMRNRPKTDDKENNKKDK